MLCARGIKSSNSVLEVHRDAQGGFVGGAAGGGTREERLPGGGGALQCSSLLQPAGGPHRQAGLTGMLCARGKKCVPWVIPKLQSCARDAQGRFVGGAAGGGTPEGERLAGGGGARQCSLLEPTLGPHLARIWGGCPVVSRAFVYLIKIIKNA